MLYQAEIRNQLPLEALSLQQTQRWSLLGEEGETQPPSDDTVLYASRLVEGVQEHGSDIDARIERYADRWPLERMPVVDRSLLRLALFELIWVPDVPVAVVINEAVEIAKAISTPDSARFINGLLGRVVEEAVD